MEKSQSIALLLAALAKAQGAFKPATKDANNALFDHKYADLASIINVTQSALAANGLAVIQIPGCNEKGPFVETLLGHESGEWVSSVLQIQPDAQGMGSAITYGRRYALQSVLRVAAEDDDGNGAQRLPDALNGSNETPKPQRERYAKLDKPAEADWLRVTMKGTREDTVKNADQSETKWFWIDFSNNLTAFTSDAELALKAATFTESPAHGRVAMMRGGKFKLLSLEPIPQ